MTTTFRRQIPLLAVLFAASPLLAQEPAQQPKAPPAPVVVSMSFPGGLLSDFVARIRAAEPRANIVVAADAARAALPPLELRGAGLEQALEAASAVAAADFTVAVREFRGGGEPVYSIVAISNPVPTQMGPRASPSNEVVTQVYSLNRLTDDPDAQRGGASTGFSAATVLSAIEVGTQDGPTAAVLRFHKDSGLLIVRGTRAQLQIVKDILSSLERDVDARRRLRNPPKMPVPEAAESSTK